MADLHFLDLNIYVLLFVYPYNSMLDCISLHSQTVHQSEGWWFGPGSLQQSLLHHLQCAHKSILSFWSTTQKPHPNVLCWPAGCSELRLDICCSLEGFSQPSNGNHWAAFSTIANPPTSPLLPTNELLIEHLRCFSAASLIVRYHLPTLSAL